MPQLNNIVVNGQWSAALVETPRTAFQSIPGCIIPALNIDGRRIAAYGGVTPKPPGGGGPKPPFDCDTDIKADQLSANTLNIPCGCDGDSCSVIASDVGITVQTGGTGTTFIDGTGVYVNNSESSFFSLQGTNQTLTLGDILIATVNDVANSLLKFDAADVNDIVMNGQTSNISMQGNGGNNISLDGNNNVISMQGDTSEITVGDVVVIFDNGGDGSIDVRGDATLIVGKEGGNSTATFNGTASDATTIDGAQISVYGSDRQNYIILNPNADMTAKPNLTARMREVSICLSGTLKKAYILMSDGYTT